MRFELTTSALPRRRSGHWSYRGNVPGAGLESACADSRTGRDAATHPGMEPSPGADPGLLPYKGRVTAVCDGGALGYENVEPPPGADPGHPPYEGGAAAVRGGLAAGQGFEP